MSRAEPTEPRMLGSSPAILALKREIARLGRLSFESVLVRGETGVGKELVSHALHAASGARGRLVVFNCPAVPADHLESELFGTTRGAFTGALDRPGAAERAARGLLVLDEVGAMPVAHQAKVLRLLENREGRRLGACDPYAVDARFVASTNEDLAAAVRCGRLRDDLYYRLVQDAVLEVPPLRARLEDVPQLAQSFLAELGEFVLTPGALAELEGHSWPGNVRELRAVVRTAGRLAFDSCWPAPVQGDHVRRALARVSLSGADAWAQTTEVEEHS